MSPSDKTKPAPLYSRLIKFSSSYAIVHLIKFSTFYIIVHLIKFSASYVIVRLIKFSTSSSLASSILSPIDKRKYKTRLGNILAKVKIYLLFHIIVIQFLTKTLFPLIIA